MADAVWTEDDTEACAEAAVAGHMPSRDLVDRVADQPDTVIEAIVGRTKELADERGISLGWVMEKVGTWRDSAEDLALLAQRDDLDDLWQM